jgi:putative phage-type endonuclease
MRKVLLQQGSDEWKAWRLTRYTASNAAAVMNCNPWFPRNQKGLLKLLTGQQSVRQNPYMEAGTRDESMIRELIETITGSKNSPSCWETEVDGLFLGASLDCYDEISGKIRDIKRPSKGSEADYFQKKEIKEHYYWQLIHQLICTPSVEAGLCIYAHDTGEIRFTETIKKYSDEFKVQSARLIAAWKEFDAKMTEF